MTVFVGRGLSVVGNSLSGGSVAGLAVLAGVYGASPAVLTHADIVGNSVEGTEDAGSAKGVAHGTGPAPAAVLANCMSGVFSSAAVEDLSRVADVAHNQGN